MSEMQHWLNVLMLNTKFPKFLYFSTIRFQQFWEKSEIPWLFHDPNKTFWFPWLFQAWNANFKFHDLSMTFPWPFHDPVNLVSITQCDWKLHTCIILLTWTNWTPNYYIHELQNDNVIVKEPNSQFVLTRAQPRTLSCVKVYLSY